MSFIHDFASAQQAVTTSLVNTIRSTSAIAAEDVNFHRSSNPQLGDLIDTQTRRLLILAQKVLQNASSAATTVRVGLEDVEDIDSNWKRIVDTVDSLLERADTCLDEFSGLRKQHDASLREQSPAPKQRTPKKAQNFRTADVPKPQLLFEHKPDNFAPGPFKPFLTSKPHATVPLEKSLIITKNYRDQDQYEHPYHKEIEEYRYPSSVYTQTDPVPYLPWDHSTATFVDDYDGVLAMLEELKGAAEIAIDLEHHDTHSYIGMVSLMQISTRNKDWIVDTLKPWRRKLEVLNEVLADPKILKIFHGAQSDIIWLQRDLGLYVVGLFDTHHASRVLGYAGGSLAFLLKKFIDFDAQKQYQLADWRVRPLPQELFDYARSDTHFLLYIYDNMRNELIERSDLSKPDEDRLQAVLERSKDYALQRYEHIQYDFEKGLSKGGWFHLLQKNLTHFSREQFAVYRRVHRWRDTAARQEDENTNTIMANHVLFNIARVLPRDIAGLLAVSHPLSQTVRVRAAELLDLIVQTLANADKEPDMTAKLSEIMNEMGDRYGASTSTIAVAPTIAALQSTVSPAGATAAVTSDANIRAVTSSFWGGLVGEALPAVPITMVNLDRLVQTLPHLSSSAVTAFAEQIDAETPSSTPKPSKAQSIVQSALTTPSSLGKRKASVLVDSDYPSAAVTPAESDAIASQADVTSLAPSADEEEDPTAARAERKRQRKAERKAAQEARRAARAAAAAQGSQHESGQAQDAMDDEDEDPSVPFDYANAPSVLNADIASQTGPIRRDKRAGKEKHFNPYAKSLAAPGGLKRRQETRTGRSGTFRS